MQITSRAVFAESTTATTYHKSKLQISKTKKNFSLISQPLILPYNFTTETSHSTNKKKKEKTAQICSYSQFLSEIDHKGPCVNTYV